MAPWNSNIDGTGRSGLSDAQLMQRFRRGDQEAFHQLVDRHARHLFSLAVALAGNVADAEDIVQETLTGACKAAGAFRHESSVRTWLVRILCRQAARWRRSGRRRTFPLYQQNGSPAVEPAVDSSTARSDRKLDVALMLQQLSPEHRQVLVLREFEQMSYDEMAVVLGVPRGTVESRLHRARQELRARLEGYGYGL